VDYDADTNTKLDEGFKEFKKGGSCTITLTPAGSPDTYTVDFQINKQTNNRSKFQRQIRKYNSYSNSPASSSGSHSTSPKKEVRSSVPTGIKVITSLLLPRDVWHINDIGQLRLDTDGLPPKTEAPHITLLDSFSSPDRIVKAATVFREAAAQIEPFEIELKKICYFSHSKRGWTIYAQPDVLLVNNKNPLKELQRLLYQGVSKSDCEWLEFKTTPQKFLPHVSLGKVSSQEKLEQIQTKLSQSWQPIRFRVQEIFLLSKLVHDTTVRYVIPLGGIPEGSPGDFLPVAFPEGTYSININWIPPGSSDEDLRDLFAKVYNTVVEAKIIFKTIEKQNYTKGWGNVVFTNKAHRDNAISKKWILHSKPLELFPCD